MIKDLNAVFLNNLKEVYFIEKSLVKVLGKLKSKMSMSDIKANLESHKKDTMDHVRRIEEIFDWIGIKRTESKVGTLTVMEKELDSKLNKNLSKEAKDFFILEAATKTERMEISYYESMILIAKEIDFESKVKILSNLRKNLSDEERALKKVNSAIKKQIPLWKRIAY